MRVFAISDIHIDYYANSKWVANLSTTDYRDDVLILAGDVTDERKLLEWCLGTLAKLFKKVLFVPGNHDLWVIRDGAQKTSLEKFDEVRAVAESSGASMRPFVAPGLAIVPLLGWYDYSFGAPSDDLKAVWMDYRACRWPAGYSDLDVAAHFASLNDAQPRPRNETVITYSHFLPRIDVMPSSIPSAGRLLYPILGSLEIERQLRALGSSMHVYGHSHVNRRVTLDGVTYVNNAFGYPSEAWMTAKGLLAIHES
jgi:predicted phosphodiesterase